MKLGKLFHSVTAFSLATTIARITGLARELALAYYFGASAELDLFWIAYRIPNFLRRIFAEGALSQALVPTLSALRAATEQDKAPAAATNHTVKTFINQLNSWMLAVLIVVSVLAIIAAPKLIWIFAPGLAKDPSKLMLGTKLLRIMFPALIFISLAAFNGGVLNSYQHFGVPAFAPNWFNIIIVINLVLMANKVASPVLLLAFSVVIASLVQWIFHWPSLIKLKLWPRFTVLKTNESVKKVAKLMIPALFGVSVAPINLLVDTFLLSFLPAGSVSWINYADRVTSVPLGVAGVALATVILPTLAKAYHSFNRTEFNKTLSWALQLMLVIALPCTAGLIILAKPIISVLFERGAFNYMDVVMTARAMRCLALGIMAFMSVKIFATGFYAQQNLKTPVKIAAMSVALNAILAAIFSHVWQHAGISLATALSSYFNAGMLLFSLHKRQLCAKLSTRFIFKLAVATGIMSLATYAAFMFSGLALSIRLAVAVLVAIVSYLASLHVLKIPLLSLLQA